MSTNLLRCSPGHNRGNVLPLLLQLLEELVLVLGLRAQFESLKRGNFFSFLSNTSQTGTNSVTV